MGRRLCLYDGPQGAAAHRDAAHGTGAGEGLAQFLPVRPAGLLESWQCLPQISVLKKQRRLASAKRRAVYEYTA